MLAACKGSEDADVAGAMVSGKLEGGHSLGEFLRQFPTVTRDLSVQALGEAKDSLLAKIA